MDLTAVTLTELRYLLAVAETGHFGRAAARCFVTQPTLSVQLKKLEANLGHRLVERGVKAARLTPIGEVVAQHARAMFEHLNAIGDIARGLGPHLTGELRLGVIPTLGPYLLPRLLRPLRQNFPELRLIVVEQLTASLLEMVLHHELDTALLALPVDAPGLEQLPLFEEAFWLLVSEKDPLSRSSALTESRLQGKSVLLLAEGHCLREQALSVCHEAGSHPVADFRASTLETLRHLVAAGFGCTLVPALSVEKMRETGTVVRRFRPPEPSRRIGFVWRKTYPRAQALVALAEFIQSHLPRTRVRPLALSFLQPDATLPDENQSARIEAGDP